MYVRLLLLCGLTIVQASSSDTTQENEYPYQYWNQPQSNQVATGGYNYAYQTPNRRQFTLAGILAAINPTQLALTAAAGLSNAAYTLTESQARSNDITSSNRRIGTLENSMTSLSSSVSGLSSTSSTSTSSITELCTKMKAILDIDNPSPPTDSATSGTVNPSSLSPSSPNGVANNLGGGDGTNTYSITKAIVPNGSSALTAAVPAGSGLAQIATSAIGALDKAGGSGGLDKLALSLTDFNIFRIRVVSAFNQLDNKVRELTKLSNDLTCS